MQVAHRCRCRPASARDGLACLHWAPRLWQHSCHVAERDPRCYPVILSATPVDTPCTRSRLGPVLRGKPAILCRMKRSWLPRIFAGRCLTAQAMRHRTQRQPLGLLGRVQHGVHASSRRHERHRDGWASELRRARSNRLRRRDGRLADHRIRSWSDHVHWSLPGRFSRPAHARCRP